LLERLAETAATAGRRAGGSRECFYEFGGHPVRLRFAGPGLQPALTAALAHLEVPPAASPMLTIDVWDSETTRTPMPAPPWNPGDYLEHGRIRGYFGEDLFAVFSPGTSSLSVVDRAAGQAYHWTTAPGALPDIVSAGPFHTILHLWAEAHELQLVHAAAVGSPNGCVLLVGPGGRGKSTIALTCLGEGVGYLGDDYCLVGVGDPPLVASMYSSGKLRDDVLSRLPWLVSRIANPHRCESEKAIVFLHEHWPELLVRNAPLRAVVLPRPSRGADSTIRAATRSDAFAAVAPSTVLQLAGGSARTFGRLRDLVGSVPAFHLDAGTDPARLAAAVTSLLK
jgi:hypothetical protein